MPSALSKTALLAAGDLVALLAFAAAGRANHGEGIDAETLITALPFIVGWFGTAPFLGGFGAAPQGGDVNGHNLITL